jgi:hypothetical protein
MRPDHLTGDALSIATLSDGLAAEICRRPGPSDRPKARITPGLLRISSEREWAPIEHVGCLRQRTDPYVSVTDVLSRPLELASRALDRARRRSQSLL